MNFRFSIGILLSASVHGAAAWWSMSLPIHAPTPLRSGMVSIDFITKAAVTSPLVEESRTHSQDTKKTPLETKVLSQPDRSPVDPRISLGRTEVPLRQRPEKTRIPRTEPETVRVEVKRSPVPPEVRRLRPHQMASNSSLGAPATHEEPVGARTDARPRSAIYPPFPRAAQLQGLQGKVVIRFTVNESGKVINPTVAKSSGHAVFDEAALSFIQTVAYEPAHVGSRPIAAEQWLEISYRLQ